MFKFCRLWIIVLFLFFTSCSGVSKRDTNDSINHLESLQKIKGAIVSGYIVDMDSKEVISSLNMNYRMTPASLSKIFTSSAALIQFGPAYRFKTQISISSSDVNNGVLTGDLIISGGGDPTLGSKYFVSTRSDSIFEKIHLSLKNRGVELVSGELIIISDYFLQPRYPSLRLWEDMSNYYGAPPSGLSFLDNTFNVTLESPFKIGGLCRVVNISPRCDFNLDCRVKASSSQKDSAYIYGFPGLKEWYIDGSIPAGKSEFIVKGAIPYPEQIFGQQLKKYLNKNGISIDKLSFNSSENIDESVIIGEIESPPLSSIIKVLNKRSVNLFADHLFLLMAKNSGSANWDNARKVFATFWDEKIGTNEIYLHDGSGLSPFNFCTPVDMVNVLTIMSQHDLGGVFKQSLSISGVDGTLKRIWNRPETKGRVVGKSGYMKGVLGYAGYITTKNSKELAFCVIANRFTEPVNVVRELIEMEITKIIMEN